MKQYWLSIILVISVVIIIAGTSVVSSTTKRITEDLKTELQILEKPKILNTEGNTILFEDDFNDNEKDLTKWREIYTDGIWTETNQRTEFMVWEPGYGYRNKEGIESIEFIAPISENIPIVVTWDIITDIHSTNWAGKLFLEVTDGTNWVWARYHRYQLATHFMDSKDNEYTYLSTYIPNGYYSNEIKIFSDRYKVNMAGTSSGMIFKSLFKPDTPLTVRIYIICAGEQPHLHQRSGFDNVKVIVGENEDSPQKALIVGRIKNPIRNNGQVIFDAIRTHILTIKPFSFKTFSNKETLITYGPNIGLVTNSFACGIFYVTI